MYGKTIKYTDYNGEEKVKTFYFNLTKTEITKMNLIQKGGMKEYIRQIVNEEDNVKMFEMFENIVLGAYGEKSVDGEDFLKSQEIRERFQRHPAYDALFIQLIEGGENAMSDFINQIMPKDWSDRIDENTKNEARKFLRPEPN